MIQCVPALRESRPHPACVAGMTLRIKCSSRPLPRPQRGSTFPLALTLVLAVRAMGTGSIPALRPPLDSRKLFSASLEVCGLPVG